MNTPLLKYSKLAVPTAVILLTMACSSPATKPDGAVGVREKLTDLQSDQKLASRAQLAIKEAESATRMAERPEREQAVAQHRIYMADHKVEIAIAIAQSRLLEDQRKALIDQRDASRLSARTTEANFARQKMQDAKRRNAKLEQELADLNAKKSDRGMVLTLGDLLFETGKSDLKFGIADNLDKLSLFLNQNQDRQLIIEGYTDNIGSDAFNLSLSQDRADSVKSYLLKQGIASYRMQSSGKGEGTPIASNDSAQGRQRNRRVEIIIPNEAY
ncbi:OmpA family protein [Simiduia aestuariiviva]|uniref:Outer membrane protein OmpA-like peptidoglycan-associated protein n=1 Tax=Simiduia aestuariiviva TaxID=1510459 RepID=A0A839UUI8_9GAMM|nr:OmpA family protein [Simiduia aestuariiviva]MBB3169025.1 outer membrane protein OmpA-like peptidoglycan-associated protein [Simiduia aestuariiviva]